jgi:hypothetical protein
MKINPKPVNKTIIRRGKKTKELPLGADPSNSSTN